MWWGLGNGHEGVLQWSGLKLYSGLYMASAVFGPEKSEAYTYGLQPISPYRDGVDNHRCHIRGDDKFS